MFKALKKFADQKLLLLSSASNCLVFIAFSALAQEDSKITHGVYTWPEKNSSILLEGRANDLEYLQITANSLAPSAVRLVVNLPDKEEHLLIIKSGVLTVGLRDSVYSIGSGSVVMLMPGENYFMQNAGTETCQYHLMKYTSKEPVNIERGKSSGGSFVTDWNKLVFKPHERGGVRSYFNRPTAMAKRFEMHVTTLKEGFNSHAPHTHNAEEILLVLEGKVKVLIGEKNYKASQGDLVFVTSSILHGLKNDGAGQCSYFAFQWE